MHRKWIVPGVLALILAGGRAASARTPVALAPACWAQSDTLTLSLAEAQRCALAQNPAFLAERQAGEVARGQLRQARLHPFNPELELQAPGAGTDGALDAYEIALRQEVEWAGQRSLRLRAARLGVDRAESGVRDAARRTLADVSVAYYTALAAESRLSVAHELSDLGRRLLAATRIQLREGEISVMEANLAQIEAGRARARVLTARREASRARLMLQQLVGIAPDREVRLENEVPAAPDPAAIDLDSLIALALVRRPDLAAQSSAVVQYDALALLTRREAIPNLRIGIFAAREALPNDAAGSPGAPAGARTLESPRVGLGVSVPIPLFDRNQGVVAERSAQAEQARYGREALELGVRTEVTDALRAYRAAGEEVGVFERDVLQPARSNQELLEIAYRDGKVDLATLILLRNQLLDAELGYWDAWLAQRLALVDLEAATAALPLPVDSPAR